MLNQIANSADPEQSLQQFQAELTRFRLEYDCGMEEVATKIPECADCGKVCAVEDLDENGNCAKCAEQNKDN